MKTGTRIAGVVSAVVILLFLFPFSAKSQQGNLIPTSHTQKNFLKAYKLVMEAADYDFRSTGSSMDKVLFPDYGEFSVYWINSGDNKGTFVYPDEIPVEYSYVTTTSYSNYNWQSASQLSIQYKRNPRTIAIFKSMHQADSLSLTWESIQFIKLFESYLDDDIYYTINEEELALNGLDENTRLLIIPAFTVKGDDYDYYIDSILDLGYSFKPRLDEFLESGGMIYTEANAACLIEKLGYLESGTIDYDNYIVSENDFFNVKAIDDSHPVAFSIEPSSGKLFGNRMPVVNPTNVNALVSLSADNNPVVYKVKNEDAHGGQILCNLGLPLVKGLADLEYGGRQLQWTLNAILSAFCEPIDITRSVRNELIFPVTAGKNAISYDRIDTFNVEIMLRNLSSETVQDIIVSEKIPPYFRFKGIITGESAVLESNVLTFSGISLGPHSEQTIIYQLITPDPDDKIHEDVEMYLDTGTYIMASLNTTSYTISGVNYVFQKNRNYADLLFSARIFADTDVNWKNFLGLDYQPFKVFMIMENKSRTSAEDVVYTQYIPKDVPFYWVDNSINIPILKTPGGKFVDVLKGSNDQDNPDYDMDSDGHPDVWLDTASIYPKGYSITEEEIYWANPWNHLRTGDESFVFEDIDHDGDFAEDTNGDGIVENDEPGDKIRVWKVTWKVGTMNGYQYYDPYCSYEIWVDPPDLVPLSAGVGYVSGSMDIEYPGMFYPYTPDINSANLADTTWTHWMMRDENGDVIWKQLIHQRINNYEGYTFIDTAKSDYKLLPTDSVIGTAPQPCLEFIAVLSLGGEEIDMRHPTPTQSLYSKVNYKTIFDEDRVTPIRTTYTYYAPLPNPLQFEYLSNNYSIYDSTGNTVRYLPEWGKAHLVFDVDASTEYTYYWIRNAGHDVDYNDPSLAAEGVESLGDGVFGYFIYDLPKGLGGYKITLPKNEDGSYNTDSIVEINGMPFTKWIDNPNTWNEVEIWEDPFQYHVYIPQLLIPPALDDDNGDGIDDWIDDRGDRFCSKTGFLHDAFMLDNGEDWLDYPAVPFQDDIYGRVDSGWYQGADGTYGDDYFETLGKTHIRIHADYTGSGREGPIEISKGGTLVVEEIFGGSPWVIFSHVLSGFAQGLDYALTSSVSPSLVKFGIDTVCIKHVLQDENEPHYFDGSFDPYHLSFGYEESTITTFVGAMDPCSLIEPAIEMPAILDAAYDNHSVTLIPLADADNPDLTGYPRHVQGTFLEVRFEVMNGTDDNWINTTVTPQLPAELGSTHLELSYVAYPRPLVPSHADGSGNIIPGDQPGTFTTGWRFNQPEGEVLVKMGNTLNLLQPTRRAYFVFLLSIDPSLENGIYEIPFSITGNRFYYTGTDHGTISYEVPSAKFCIAEKDMFGQVSEFEKIILDSGQPDRLEVFPTENFQSLHAAKWSLQDVEANDFSTIINELPIEHQANMEIISLDTVGIFPSVEKTKIYILQQGIIDSYNTSDEKIKITEGQQMVYSCGSPDLLAVTSGPIWVTPVGPKNKITNRIYMVNGVPADDTLQFESDEEILVTTLLTIRNNGTDVSSNTTVTIYPGDYYDVLTDQLPSDCQYKDGMLIVSAGLLIPGDKYEQLLPFRLSENIPKDVDLRPIIELSEIDYEGTAVEAEFSFSNPDTILFNVYDFEIEELTYSFLSDTKVRVTATAGNRGKPAGNIWFRIYPIFGGGAYEFPIAEMLIDTFMTTETVTLNGDFTIPNINKSIEFIAIIDDSKSFHEVIELNNSLKTLFDISVSVNDIEAETVFSELYPNPFTDEVNLEYNLAEDYGKVQIMIYDISGKACLSIADLPAYKGSHFIVRRFSDLEKGLYLCRIVATGRNVETFIKTSKLIKE
jgi:hypothetical protein